MALDTFSPPVHARNWWRNAVIYQIYPRSFSDNNADGVGDLIGITNRLEKLSELNIDAVWISPFQSSPQKDAGYDVSDYCNVDPLFGTLEDFDRLLQRAHELNLHVIIDLVPNHTSSAHQWFQEALAAPPGSPERERYKFRNGKGQNGELPPNNWESIFGGPAWTRVSNPDGTPGQWYLHLFDSSQPDLNWDNPWVHDQFECILRFWLDRGVDGFRVDVAHALIKEKGLPDYNLPEESAGLTMTQPENDPSDVLPPYFGQPEVHEIYHVWRNIIDSYPDERVLCAEAWVQPLERMALWTRSDEMHQAFNFSYLMSSWDKDTLRSVIDRSITAFGEVGAPSTWVLSNHDVIRHTTRLSLSTDVPQGVGVGPKTTGLPELHQGLHRALAATALMLALPGSAYLYQGEELGLPEVIDIPDDKRADPTWFRTQGERYGRDGCRVPLPWDLSSESYGFNTSSKSWLPQPEIWSQYARSVQENEPSSTLNLYKKALKLRAKHDLGFGNLSWQDAGENVLSFKTRDIHVVVNFGQEDFPLPEGSVLLASGLLNDRALPTDTTAWIQV